jgi:hypothetical protein
MADRVVWMRSGAIARQKRVAKPMEAQDLQW